MDNKEEKERKDDEEDEYEFPAFKFPVDESKIDGEVCVFTVFVFGIIHSF